MKKSQKKRRIWLISFSLVLAVMLILCGVYVSDYYHANTPAISAFSCSEHIEKTCLSDDTIVYTPEQSTAGLIFYPGGKVEYTAYEPLMKACAEYNILCVLVPMPFHLAVLDPNAADGIREQFPELEDWYMGGHSLGGAMAASYLAKHTDAFEGLILLGSYSTADLSETDLDILSVYGSEDKILNKEKYTECLPNLPDNFTEYILDGGCHAYFGMYGEQEGDGIPTLSNEEQIRMTAGKIGEYITGL